MRYADERLVPPGWQIQRSEVIFETFPNASLAAPLARPKTKPDAPRPNAVISLVRGPTAGTSAPAALAPPLFELAKIAPGFVTHDSRELTLADGAKGHAVQVSFEAAPGMRATQLHLARLDGKVLTHATATVESHRDRELPDLETVMLKLLENRGTAAG